MVNRFLNRSVDAAIATACVLSLCLLSAGAVRGATLQLNSLVNIVSLEGTPTDPLTLPKDFITPELLSNLLAQLPANEETGVNFAWESAASVSDTDPLSAESIVSALKQLRFDREGSAGEADVPVLPQTALSDVYEGIYGFSSSSERTLSEPFGSATFTKSEEAPPLQGGVSLTYQPPRPLSAPSAVGNVTSGGGGVRPPSLTGIGPLSLPRFGGPLQAIGRPQRQFGNPIRPVSPPAIARSQTGEWGDAEVDVFFRSMPEQEVVNLDLFLRTIYRTSPSAMLEQLEKSLDVKIDVELQTMPAPVFANPYKRAPAPWPRNL